MTRKFYIDMDDTLGDFRGHAIACGVPPWSGTWYTTDRSTWTAEQIEIQRQTNEVMMREDFWSSIPLLPGSSLILQAAMCRGETYILTAYPHTCPDRDMVKRVKERWALRNAAIPRYGSPPVIVCDRPEKVRYATSVQTGSHSYGCTQHVLLDDALQNCEEWTKAGGVAIHYDRDNWRAALAMIWSS